MPRTIDCQLFTHSGKHLDNQDDEAALAEANFPKEFKPIINARDAMSSMHNALATLVGNPITVVRLIDLPAGGCTTATEGFVNKFATYSMIPFGPTNTSHSPSLLPSTVSSPDLRECLA
ncbi:hypothetical protein N7501_011967 [Penicillium viridicatum]|nr:hypothetical protein N7501_011967 [Penicillium viridicatum]